LGTPPPPLGRRRRGASETAASHNPTNQRHPGTQMPAWPSALVAAMAAGAQRLRRRLRPDKALGPNDAGGGGSAGAASCRVPSSRGRRKRGWEKTCAPHAQIRGQQNWLQPAPLASGGAGSAGETGASRQPSEREASGAPSAGAPLGLASMAKAGRASCRAPGRQAGKGWGQQQHEGPASPSMMRQVGSASTSAGPRQYGRGGAEALAGARARGTGAGPGQ